MRIDKRIEKVLPEWRERQKRLVQDHGEVTVADVTIDQIYSGIRGVPIGVSDISYVDPMEGLRLRGYSVEEVLKLLPKPRDGEYPLVGGLFYLLMTGEIPSQEEADQIEVEWKIRSNIPDHVFDLLRRMPKYTHPMTLFSQAILALQTESSFARRYYYGIENKADYWTYYLEDSLNLNCEITCNRCKHLQLEIPRGYFRESKSEP